MANHYDVWPAVALIATALILLFVWKKYGHRIIAWFRKTYLAAKAYYLDIRGEMKRVTWPSRTKVESTTVVVILSVFAFALYFKVVDTVIQATVVAGYDRLAK